MAVDQSQPFNPETFSTQVAFRMGLALHVALVEEKRVSCIMKAPLFHWLTLLDSRWEAIEWAYEDVGKKIVGIQVILEESPFTPFSLQEVALRKPEAVCLGIEFGVESSGMRKTA